MALHQDDADLFEYNLITPTPRATNFPPIHIPTQSYPTDVLSAYDSPDTTGSPYTSPSPQSSTNTSLSMSPTFPSMDLPEDVDEYAPQMNTFTAPLSKSTKQPARARTNPPPRKGDPSYIPRPENAFILFRKDAVAKMRAQEAAEAEQCPIPPRKGEKGKRQRQADMSKNISHLWRELSKEERTIWEERAAQIKREHEQKHPEYRYQPARSTAAQKRLGNKGTTKSRLVRSKRSVFDEDDSGCMSEDLAVVVRATRGPRRGSTCSTASSVSSFADATSPISLPSLHATSRSSSPYPPLSYQRVPRGSRQWVLPPAEDPSPPPTEIYFPHSGDVSALDQYNGGLMELQAASLRQRDREHSRRAPREEGAVFVEPITQDRNPWSPGGSKHPSTPKRQRTTRPRSLSQPHPLQYTQADPVQLPQPSTSVSATSYLPWSPASSDAACSISPLDLPWTPLDQVCPGLSSPESDCHTDFGSFDLSNEDWMNMLEPHHNMDLVFAEDTNGMFGFQPFDSQAEDDEEPRPYQVVNLDSEGRPRSFF